jgi:PPM family protein phosphatase
MIEFGHAAHTGLRRPHNEDTYWADADLGLFLVADGMGGPGRGEVASAVARDALVDAVRAGRPLAPAIEAAGRAIRALPPRPGSLPTGTALAALRLAPPAYELAWVGDCRAYLWQNDRLVLPTPDATPEEARAEADHAHARPERRVTQALGITPEHELCADPIRGHLERGMQFLLCSDGLTDELDDTHIARLLSRRELAAQECVDHLLLDALDAGGRDNIGIVLVRML